MSIPNGQKSRTQTPAEPEYTLGTDEAGYGPNLGPLVVGGTLWCGEVDAETSATLLGDSKKLYTARGSLARLEQGVLGAVRTLSDDVPETWKTLRDGLAGKNLKRKSPKPSLSEPCMPEPPWETGFDLPLPVDTRREEIETAATLLGNLRGLHCRVVQPAEFNAALARGLNKSDLLLETTLDTITTLLNTVPDGATVRVQADKLGGRNSYVAALYGRFPEAAIGIVREGREASVYNFRDEKNRQIELRFEAKGERHPQTALASMVAKYLRELAMRAFNRFWCEKRPGLQPTAGYPEDAKRFAAEIETVRRTLEVPLEILWRAK